MPCPEPPLQALRTLIAESRIELPETLPPMAAGVFGYLGYDMVRLMEDLRRAQSRSDRHSRRRAGAPDAHRGVRRGEGLDHGRDAGAAGKERRRPGRADARAASAWPASWKASTARSTNRLVEFDAGPLDVPPQSNTTPDEYKAMVRKAKDYIAAGDIFQVVLSQRFEAPFALPPFSLYRALRRVNPSPFLYFLDFGALRVVGSSPEILVRVRDGMVTIRPIAGTRPRGATPHEDKALEDELLADPKERAEHLMLLDLGRNDVGRVAEIGSVKVTDQFFVERYSHVMHIVSNVEGKLGADRDALDALAAGFPAGTVSGAPKVRAMEIIDELEKEKRGLYAGCVGYFSADGEMDTCIVLRTALVKDGKMYVQAGAGIVADSDPELEQQECVNKAKALFRAAEEAAPLRQRREARAVTSLNPGCLTPLGPRLKTLRRADKT